MPPIANPALGRRAALKMLAGASVAATFARSGAAESGEDKANEALVKHLESLARADGGYAWAAQEQSHLTPTYYVIGCYRAIGRQPPNPADLAEFVRTHHPRELKKLEQERRGFEYQQVQALTWLNADASDFVPKIQAWTRAVAYLKQYEKHGYPVFQSELGAIACRALLRLPTEDLAPEFREYVHSRRRLNGSFNNTPTTDGGDGHVMNTWWGLQALSVLGNDKALAAETIAWLRQCQLPSGGFTWQPNAPFAAVDDAAYTWAAVRALHALGASPLDRGGCIAWLRSLATGDGGYADRPGWLSNPMATYYAVDSLATLGAAQAQSAPRRAAPASHKLPSDLKVWSIQLEAHGKGSPADAVNLASALRIHLWGAKNAEPAWIARAQAVADTLKVPVQFVVSNEEYGTWVDVPGLGTYSHTSDILAPAAAPIGTAMPNGVVHSWPEFRERRLAPLTAGKGRLIWQFGENEELVRLFLDDSLERGGYAAISTFHFGNPDFTNSEPFLHRWRGRIPFVALQDAHGAEPWWFADMTTGFRTLFLATEPTWEGWLHALEKNWVAAARHDQWSRFKTWMHTGSPEVAEFIRQREADWRWWDNPAIQRPLVSIVALRPGDPFEAGCPESGVAIRVRCARENSPQGLVKKPISELLLLKVDGKEVPTQLSMTGGAGTIDVYHVANFTDLAAGAHTATARVRVVETGAESERTVQFSV